MPMTRYASMFLLTAMMIEPHLATANRAVAAEPPVSVENADWPSFHGSRRDNISPDTGLLDQWPEEGPELIWRIDGIGEGYASVAIVGDKIFTAGNIGDNTVISALNMSGKILWRENNGPAYSRSFPGARATPTVAGGKLYHLNGDGDVICLDAASGRPVWTLNVFEKFAGRNTTWGLSESLLVDGDRVICTPGGQEIGMVALDKDTGRTVWTCTGPGDKPGYAAPILIETGGLRQIVTMMSASAVGVAAETGRLLWTYKHKVAYDVNVATPVYRDGHLALFGTWGRGATMLKLLVDGENCSVETVWHTKELDNEHGGVVLVGDCLFGQADGNHKRRHWACLRWKTGKTSYAVEGLPVKRSGTLTYADGMLYVLSDRGTVALLTPTPEKFDVVSRFSLPEGGKGPLWAHPVVNRGRLYVRHGRFLYAYDVASNK